MIKIRKNGEGALIGDEWKRSIQKERVGGAMNYSKEIQKSLKELYYFIFNFSYLYIHVYVHIYMNT